MIRPAEEGKLEVSYRLFRTCKDAGEIKRMYVRPKFQRVKLGDLVLDLFCGSMTTGKVSQRFNRQFVGYDVQVY